MRFMVNNISYTCIWASFFDFFEGLVHLAFISFKKP